MDQTAAGTRAAAVGAALITSAGLSTVVYGIIIENLERTVGGAIFTMTALTLIALVLIRRWITSAATDRQRHDDAVRAADTERMRYVAAQAALEVERGRLRKDVASEHKRLTATHDAERAAMHARFEEERNALICETIETTVGLVRDGLLNPTTHQYGQIIGFPSPAHQRAAEEPARGRGATRG
ncbi:hypothetical protein ABT081_02650 [Streptomyces sp. NPDC002238]|uniref:hypothetical protein n=1 Tax=Streptomyces sp. NPDC002238 TaxID=3156649 RepID=UPI00332ED9C5